jgi:hypothetical protein
LEARFGNKGPTYTAKVKSTLEDSFSAYSSQTPDSNNNCQPRSNDEIVYEDDSWADREQHWEQHLTTQKKSAVKNELVYEDDLFPRQKDLDILQWWIMHSAKYPVLSRMARDLFAAPASTIASESAFSTSGRVISDYRSRLTSKNIEALICIQDWLRAEGNLMLIVFSNKLVQGNFMLIVFILKYMLTSSSYFKSY